MDEMLSVGPSVSLYHLLLDKALIFLVDFLRKGTYIPWVLECSELFCMAPLILARQLVYLKGHAFFPCLNTIPMLLWFSVLFWGIWMPILLAIFAWRHWECFFFFFPLKFILLLLCIQGTLSVCICWSSLFL